MANNSTNSSLENYFQDKTTHLTGLQKQWIDRIYGGTILLLNIVITMYHVRILKGSVSSEKSHFIQLLYISINDCIIGTTLIAIGMIDVDGAPSAYMCSLSFILLGGFNATCQLNIMFACIQRYKKIKTAHLTTKGWKTSYTHGLQAINVFVAIVILSILFVFASITAIEPLKRTCWLNKINQFVMRMSMNGTWVFMFFVLITSDILLILTFKILKKPEIQRSSSLQTQRKIFNTLIFMTVSYNLSLLPMLVQVPIQKLTFYLKNDIVASFFLWFVYVNSLLNPIILMSRIDKIHNLIRHDMQLFFDIIDIPFGAFCNWCLRSFLPARKLPLTEGARSVSA